MRQRITFQLPSATFYIGQFVGIKYLEKTGNYPYILGMLEKFRKYRLLACIIVLFAAIGIFRLNNVSLFSPDSTMYLIWGNAIAHGQGFVDYTQPEAERFVANAPLYAAFLAPVEIIFPMSMIAAKIWTLLWGCMAAALFYFWIDGVRGWRSALAGTIIFLANPLILIYSTEVLSEAPFLVIVLALALLVERSTKHLGTDRWSSILFLFLSGCAVIMRDVGVAVVLSVGTMLVFQKRYRLAFGILAAGAVMYTLWYWRNTILIGIPPGTREGNLNVLFKHFLTAPDDSILYEFASRLNANFHAYASLLGGMLFFPLYTETPIHLIVNPSGLFEFFTGFFAWTKIGVALIVASCIIAGNVIDIRRNRTGVFRLLFIIFFLGIIMLYPVYDIRFLIPLLPMMILFLFYGVEFAVELVVRRRLHGSIIFAAMFLLMTPNFIAVWEVVRTNVEYLTNPNSFIASNRRTPVLFTLRWSDMEEWTSRNVEKDAVIAAPIKDFARFRGSGKVLIIDPVMPEYEFEEGLRQYNVQYLLTTWWFGDFQTYEFLMQESHRYAFTPVHSSEGLQLYRVTSQLEHPGIQNTPFSARFNTVTAAGLVRLARHEILSRRFDEAFKHLQFAQALDPTLEEPIYQTVVGAVLSGDLPRAQVAYRRLLATPQTLRESEMAADLMQAMNLCARADINTTDGAKLIRDASLIYWKNGYYTHARDILEPVLAKWPNFLNGLVRSVHFNLQLGDTATALKHLEQAQNIDPKKSNVQTFIAIAQYLGALQKAESGLERARLHVAMAEQYASLTAEDIALDEAQRALSEDPSYIPAMEFLGNVFETKGRYQTAAFWYRRLVAANPSDTTAYSRLQRIDSLAAEQSVNIK